MTTYDFAERQAERAARAAARDSEAAAELRAHIARAASAHGPDGYAALILRRRRGELSAADHEQMRSWYQASRWLGSGLAPEDFASLDDEELAAASLPRA